MRKSVFSLMMYPNLQYYMNDKKFMQRGEIYVVKQIYDIFLILVASITAEENFHNIYVYKGKCKR